MLQESSNNVVSLDSEDEIPDDEWVAATQQDDEYDDATRALLHAPTLRLGETDDDGPAAMPDDGPVATANHTEKPHSEAADEMELMRLENLRMAEELAELRRLKALPAPVTSPTHQKAIFTPKETPVPTPSNSAASPEASEDLADGALKNGEEEIAEEMDLSHKDRLIKFMAHALTRPL